ncbi:MAG: FkbM family methyltransferase [Caldilineales bacterium]|nr:FkbM family methyltransferase [Caldilineales bacterium]
MPSESSSASPTFADLWGLARSLLIYHRPLRTRQLSRFYSQFIRPGDLCFDIGAHVGNRVRAWLGLGARVAAIEPQPRLMRLLRLWYGSNPNVILIEAAVGQMPGRLTLQLSRRNPTVATLSPEWRRRISQTGGFARVRWDDSTEVEVVTMDELIARHGKPAFCKIDVEGFEAEVLAGLSQPLPCLSFEIMAATPDATAASLERLDTLAAYKYNFSPGESLRMQWPEFVSSNMLRDWLRDQGDMAASGDVYARLLSH